MSVVELVYTTAAKGMSKSNQEDEMQMFERRVVVEHRHMDRYGSEEDSVKVGSCGRVNNRKTGR